MMPPIALQLRAVDITYARKRLWRAAPAATVTGVSFDVESGTTFGIVGESGSGKSSIARAIVGLQPISSGQILRDGRAVVGPRPGTSSRIQMIFQDPDSSLDPHLTVLDSVIEPLRIMRLPASARRLKAEQLLNSVGLNSDLHERRPRFLSGGQKQRVAIARALACEPEILVADEPVSALDVSVQAQVLNLLLDLQRDRGLTIVLISHDLAVVNHMSDHIGVMSAGRLVETGSAEAIISDPQHPYTQSLLAAAPGRHLISGTEGPS